MSKLGVTCILVLFVIWAILATSFIMSIKEPMTGIFCNPPCNECLELFIRTDEDCKDKHDQKHEGSAEDNRNGEDLHKLSKPKVVVSKH